MTGPEHYREAEQYAEIAVQDIHDAIAAAVDGNQAEAAKRYAWAVHTREMGMLHATLAQTAATALNDYPNGTSVEDLAAWRSVAGTKPEGGA